MYKLKLTCAWRRVTRKHWPPVRGPPLRTGSADYLWTGPRTTPTDPLYGPPPKLEWKKKERNISVIGCLIDRVSEIANFTFCKFNVLGVQARAQVVSLHIAISFAVAILYIKGSESLQKASRKPPGSLGICALSPPPFCSARSHVDSWTRSRLHNLLSAVTDTNKLERPKNTSSIARLGHEYNVTIFLLFAIGISLRWKKPIGSFWGGGGREGVNYICTV